MDYALRISFLWLHKGYPQTVDWIIFIISQYLSAKYLNWLCCEPLGQLRFSHGSEFLMRLQFPKYQLGLESLVTSNLSCGKICIQTYSQGHCQTSCNHWLTTQSASCQVGLPMRQLATWQPASPQWGLWGKGSKAWCPRSKLESL